MNLVDKAMQLAIQSHHGQINNHDGEPYLLHCMRVWMIVRDSGGSELAQATAWLHDTLEDTDTSFLNLWTLDAELASAVWCLSKIAGESNEEYYHRVHASDIATEVKLADIADNFGRNHLIEDEATRLRMAKKYSLGMDILKRPYLDV